jgi:hypothetical protein
MSMMDGKVTVPDANIQPIASKDVALFMSEKALAVPTNKIIEISGPDKFSIAAWVKQYEQATHKNHEIVADAKALYSGAPLKADTLIPESAVFRGKTKYADWIAIPANQQ